MQQWLNMTKDEMWKNQTNVTKLNWDTEYCDQDKKIHIKKSQLRETKHLSTDADSSTDTTVGWTKNTPKTEFIENGKTQKRIEICKNLRYALWPEVSNPLGSVVSGWTKNAPKPVFFEKRKKSSKTQKLKNI